MRALASGACSSRTAAPRAKTGEFLRDCLDELVVFQIAGCGEDHVAAEETATVIVDELSLIEFPHRRCGPENRLAQRMVFPEVLREQLVHQDVGIVFVDLDLFKNHAAFAFDVARGKGGVQHQVGQHIERNGHVLGKRFHVEANGLFAGEGVKVAANGIHLACNTQRGAGARSFENHVFDKMRNAIGFRWLAARPGFDPHTHGNGAQMFHALGQNDQTVRQYSAFKVSFRWSLSSFRNLMSERRNF